VNHRKTFWLGGLLLLGIANGCQTAPKAPLPAKPTTAKPAEKEEPFPVKGSVQDLDSLLTDDTGQTIAEIKASIGTVSPSGSTAAGKLSGSEAVLYQDGKPAVRLTAGKVEADPDTRTIRGTGNVVATALNRPDAATIKADNVLWSHGKNKITGTGNIHISRAPDWQMSGDSFTADMTLQEFTLNANGNTSASGSIPR